MENQAQKTDTQVDAKVAPTSEKPNEKGKILVDGVVRISDPNTKEVFVEIRA
jgi:hypothetical protein